MRTVMESSRVYRRWTIYATGMGQPPCRRRCVCEAYQEKSRFLFLAMYRMRKYIWLRKTTSHLVPFTATFLSHISECCAGMNLKAAVHLKLDTGFHRMGIDCCSSIADCVEQLLPLFSLPNIEITGMYTHLVYGAGSNQRELAFTELQFQRFQSCIRALQERKFDTGICLYATVRQRYMHQICIWTWCVSVPISLVLPQPRSSA